MASESKTEVTKLIHEEIARLQPAEVRMAVGSCQIDIVQERRTYMVENGMRWGHLWVFARTSWKKVGLAYSEEGYGELGIRWGLVFFGDDDYGCSGGWYTSLQDLVDDSGHF